MPAGTTPAVFHSAALAYLPAVDRAAFVAAIIESGSRWISFEGRAVVRLNGERPGPATPDTHFVAALDRIPAALADRHGSTMSLLR